MTKKQIEYLDTVNNPNSTFGGGVKRSWESQVLMNGRLYNVLHVEFNNGKTFAINGKGGLNGCAAAISERYPTYGHTTKHTTHAKD